MQKIRKNSEKKALQTDGQTRGWMNRAEFTGPSDRAEGFITTMTLMTLFL